MSKEVEIDVRGQKIRGLLENADSKKLVILVHGFAGDLNGPEGVFNELSSLLVERGYSTFQFGFRGTEPSDGESIDVTVGSEVEDLKEVIRVMNERGYERIALLGESMGGTITAEAYDASMSLSGRVGIPQLLVGDFS